MHAWIYYFIVSNLSKDAGFEQEKLILLIDTCHRLKLKGERHIEGDRWSRFDMVVRAPKHYDTELVTAKFDPDNGLLCVTLPDSASKPPPAPATEWSDRRRRRRRLQPKASFAVHYKLKKAWERLCKLFCVRIEVNDSFKRVDSAKRWNRVMKCKCLASVGTKDCKTCKCVWPWILLLLHPQLKAIYLHHKKTFLTQFAHSLLFKYNLSITMYLVPQPI